MFYMFYNIYNVNPVNMKKEFQFKYSFYFPFLNTTNRIHINSGGFYMKHHNMSSITAKNISFAEFFSILNV
nr:hypothetical protein EEL55_29345 [Bacillus thuringiensis]